MEKPISSISLFSGSEAGLERVYQALVSANGSSNISLANVNNALSNIGTTSSNVNLSDLSFLQYLQNNFYSVDKNHDGTVNSNEMSSMVQNITNSGLTYDQLSALSSQYASSNSSIGTLLDTVMANFNEIDTNHDGKVTQAEIDSYNYDKALSNQKAEFQKQTIKNMSLFYSDAISEDSSSSDSTSNSKNKASTTIVNSNTAY